MRLHLSVTRDEALRILAVAQSMLAWRFGGVPVDVDVDVSDYSNGAGFRRLRERRFSPGR